MLRHAVAAALLVLVPAVARGDDSLDDLKKKYEALQPEIRDYWAFRDGIARDERDLIALLGRAREAEETAARSPDDKALKARADELSLEAQHASEVHDRKIPGFRAHDDAHWKKIETILRGIEALHGKQPADDAVSIFRVRFYAELGGIPKVREDAAELFAKHADDRDIRFAYAESLMVVPAPQGRGDMVRPPEFEKALSVLEPLAKAEPKTAEVQLLYGVAASAMDKNAEAAAALDSIAEITSVWPPVRILIGNAQDPDEAYVVWRDAAKGLLKTPEDAALRRKRAELELAVDASARAIHDAEIALKAKPDDKDVKKLLARSYSRAKRFEDAAPLYASLADEMEKDGELRAEHAVFLYNSGKPSESLAELMKLKDSSKFPPRLNELLRSMLFDLKKKAPDDPRIEIFLMKNAADAGAYTAIWDEVEKLWAKHQDDATLRFVYAATLMCVPVPEQRDPRQRPVEPRAPNFAKAYELLAPLVKTGDKEVLLLHGVAACAIGKDSEAKAELDAVASVDSVRPVVRELIGSAKDPRGTFEKWRSVAGGLAEHPDDPELHMKRAELLVSVDAAALAVKDAELAHKAKPDDKAIAATLGRVYLQLNHYEKALAAFTDAPADDVKGEYAAALFDANRLQDFKGAWDAASDKTAIIRHLGPAAQQMFRTMPKKVDELAAEWADEEKARAQDAKKDDNPRVQLMTEKGPIVLELFEDTAPNTVANFVWLAENGFYDGIKFHRIIAGFMAQGGDPTGTGTGGCGYDIKDELKENPRRHWRGTLSMANTGAPNSGNSQFFLCYVPNPHLNPAESMGRWRGHTVFGRIIEGQEVADALEKGDAIVKATVLRKRSHEYKPETIPIPGQTPWKPGKKE